MKELSLKGIQDYFLKPSTDALDAIENDFKTGPITTSEKVQNLVTAVMDFVTLAEVGTGAVFVLSSVYYIHSYFSTFSSLISPLTTLTMLVSGFVTHELHQTRRTIRETNDWIIENYPKFDDTFSINDAVYQQALKFNTNLRYRTFLVSKFAQPIINEGIKGLAKLKIHPLHAFALKGASIMQNPNAEKLEKQFGMASHFWSVIPNGTGLVLSLLFMPYTITALLGLRYLNNNKESIRTFLKGA